MNRREFVQATLIGGSAASTLRAGVSPQAGAANPPAEVPTATTLFPTDLLPSCSGMNSTPRDIRRRCRETFTTHSQAPCCGVPIGGISTGCVDLDAKGVYGFSTVFNGWSHWPHGIAAEGSQIARKNTRTQPLLGLAVGGQTWVLTTAEIIAGGSIEYCRDPNFKLKRLDPHVKVPQLQNVKPATEIHYWGHYPLADLEFETDAPVSVGLQAWAPFIPGNAPASNIPAAVFEIHLRNTTDTVQKGHYRLQFSQGPILRKF